MAPLATGDKVTCAPFMFLWNGDSLRKYTGAHKKPPAARHHEPFAWCVDILWAVSDFTEENGGTTIVPRSHSWLRQAGRTDRGQDGHPTPWSAPNGRAKYTVPPEQVTHRKGLLCPPLCKSPD